VYAPTGTPGSFSLRILSWRYSGRKSCPHMLTQCASSTATGGNAGGFLGIQGIPPSGHARGTRRASFSSCLRSLVVCLRAFSCAEHLCCPGVRRECRSSRSEVDLVLHQGEKRHTTSVMRIAALQAPESTATFRRPWAGTTTEFRPAHHACIRLLLQGSGSCQNPSNLSRRLPIDSTGKAGDR